MKKLIDYKVPYLARGAVFRLPAQWPYENFVDFMILEASPAFKWQIDGNIPTFALTASTGYHGGHLFGIIPNEAIVDVDEEIATKYNLKVAQVLKTDWFIENWNKWIYPDCKVEEVYVIPQGYESESLDGTPINYNRDIIVD
ncbi:MAG: hypothetical protein IK065_06330 [Neisseriaceae bacterium]|nr:hypothetical protein [Neisseriaceae bacterium]